MKFLSSVLVVISLALYVQAGLEHAKYSQKLDAANWDAKIREPEVGTLTAFFAPWCGHCKSLEGTWTKIGKTFETESKCSVAHLDADNAANKPIASRYGVSGYPTIKFLPSNGSPAVDYSGPRTEEAFTKFLNDKCGTHRAPGGDLAETAGRLPQLDELASAYLPSSVTERTDLLERAKALAGSLEGPATAIYLKIFDKLSQNNAYLTTESERIRKLLEKRATLASAKVDELQIKQNILKAFQGAKDKAEQLVNQVKAEL